MNQLDTAQILELFRVLTYSMASFLIGMWLGPSIISLLNWLKFWKKTSRKLSTTGEELVVTKKFYQENEEQKKVPRAGGILIWIVTMSMALFFWLIMKIQTNNTTQFLNFISRTETFIPLGTFFYGSVVGFIDDALVTMETGGNYMAGGLKLSQRAILVIILSLLIGLWFHFQIDFHTFNIFFWEINLNNYVLFGQSLGWLIIPITTFILLGIWGSVIIDGFDGIAAGTFIPIFVCFAGLAFVRELYDISTLMMVISGSTLAYLWFNLPPAKFYMGDTGAAGLLLTLGVVAILINYIYVLPIAGLMLILTVGSAFIQIFSKTVFKKKILLAAPLHHHFEAMGFTRNKITYAYWFVSIIMSAIGFFIGYYFR